MSSEASVGAWLATNAAVDCCDLVTTGRRTGRPHAVEIWFAAMDRAMYMICGKGTSADWYRNVLANPGVTVRLGGEARVGRASPVTDLEERHRCGDLMGAKYMWDGDPEIGLTYRSWCYDVPAIAIEF